MTKEELIKEQHDIETLGLVLGVLGLFLAFKRFRLNAKRLKN